MGLKGRELATFIKEQQILEREEREKLRQEEKEKDERLLKLRPVSYTHLTLPTNREV